jgi:transcriptional regulator with XRE-family HTH domain
MKYPIITEIYGGKMSSNERIKQIRQEAGLSQRKFAERISMSPSHIAGLELGNKQINDRIIKLICQEFGFSEYWLKTGEGSMHDEESSVRASKAMHLFKSLNTRYQDFALLHLSELVKLYNSSD